MINLKGYSDDELWLHVMNNEYFYIERDNRPYLYALINEEFYYTTDQFQVLVDALDKEEAERQ